MKKGKIKARIIIIIKDPEIISIIEVQKTRRLGKIDNNTYTVTVPSECSYIDS